MRAGDSSIISIKQRNSETKLVTTAYRGEIYPLYTKFSCLDPLEAPSLFFEGAKAV